MSNKSYFVQYHTSKVNLYGDRYSDQDVIADKASNKDEVVDWFLSNVNNHIVPEKKEWEKEVSDIGEHFTDDVYFREGYYMVDKNSNMYHFTVVRPSI